MRKREQWAIEEYCNSHGLGDDEAKLFKEHFMGLFYELTGREELNFAVELEGKIKDLENQVATLESEIENLSSVNVDLANVRDALINEVNILKSDLEDTP